jgi:hypothetical protein
MALSERERLQRVGARNQIAVQVLPVVLDKNGSDGLSEQSAKSAVALAFSIADDVVSRIDVSMSEFSPQASSLVTPKR